MPAPDFAAAGAAAGRPAATWGGGGARFFGGGGSFWGLGGGAGSILSLTGPDAARPRPRAVGSVLGHVGADTPHRGACWYRVDLVSSISAPAPTRLASPKQVASTMAVHEKTVRRWCYAGQLRAHRTPGGLIRIEVDERGLPLRNE